MRYVRTKASILAALLAVVACNKPESKVGSESAGGPRNAVDSFRPYQDPKQRFEIQDVAVATEHVDAKSTIEKLPSKLRPADPAKSKTVVLVLTLASKKDDLNEIKSSEFSLLYELDGKESEALCVGLSMGDSDMWGLAEKGETAVFVRAKPPQKQKLLFLLPSSVNEAALRHREPSGASANVKQGISLR